MGLKRRISDPCMYVNKKYIPKKIFSGHFLIKNSNGFAESEGGQEKLEINGTAILSLPPKRESRMALEKLDSCFRRNDGITSHRRFIGTSLAPDAKEKEPPSLRSICLL
jgi:hypothetical protein